MIKSFRHKGLELFFKAGSMSGIRPEQAKRLRLILGRLNVATVPRDMALPGLRLHQLKGNLKRHYSLDVSGNWRVMFRFEGLDVFDVNYLDYH